MKIEIQPKDIGKCFGDADNHEQAAFLNEMGRFSQMVCQSEARWESQMCYIADELDKNGAKLIQALHDFLALKGKLEE